MEGGAYEGQEINEEEMMHQQQYGMEEGDEGADYGQEDEPGGAGEQY